MAMILLLAAPAAGAAPLHVAGATLRDSGAAPGDAGAAAARDALLGNPAAALTSTSRGPAFGTSSDVVFGGLSPAAARISRNASSDRYSVSDGSDATIAVAVTAACQASCNAADPQQIADFVGTLIHGYEISLLTVQLDTPLQLQLDCGLDAQACYYGGRNKIVLNGNDTPGPDGASREFVLAHEYGHHVALHRHNPPPFPAPIDWGTARWSSYEHVCQRRRAGILFSGNEGFHYFRDPGEAFAETFARYRFPDAGVHWKWLPALKPDAAAFAAIRADTLNPWAGRTSFAVRGRVPRGRASAAVESFRTPLDGTVSLRPIRRDRRYRLSLMSPEGRILRGSRQGLGTRHQLNFTVCGQSRLRVKIRSLRRSGAAFRLLIRRP